MTVLTGVLYPLLVLGLTQTLFPEKANGSLIMVKDHCIGSALIGQKFTGEQYFHARPSAIDNNPVCSGASNLSITSAKLKQQVAERCVDWLSFNGLSARISVPDEMLYASGSGLDPHISPMAALQQVKRIAKARHLTEVQGNTLIALINRQTEFRQFGLLGEERINVLLLNIEMDKKFK